MWRLFIESATEDFVLIRSARGRADNLIDTIVIEPNWDPARGDKDGDPVTYHQSFGMIHLESSPAVKLHSENAKRLQLLEAFKNSVEIISSHFQTPGMLMPPTQTSMVF